MNPLIIDTYRHPYDTVSLLQWIMRTWDTEPNLPLMIITNAGDGDRLDTRLRVKLAKTRKMLQGHGLKDIKRFGMNTHVIPWSDIYGQSYEAVCLERFVTKTQTIAMIFNRMDVK